RPQWLSLALLAAGPAVAAPPPAPPAAAPAAPAAAAMTAEQAEQAELLLYLSEFEDESGDALDPADLPPGPGEDDDALR
uniref:hypothetical protein n=1 Tax=Tahibacter caeni TaxID=1453545 RepID=UPI002147C655